jgi:hypothetical protein
MADAQGEAALQPKPKLKTEAAKGQGTQGACQGRSLRNPSRHKETLAFYAPPRLAAPTATPVHPRCHPGPTDITFLPLGRHLLPPPQPPACAARADHPSSGPRRFAGSQLDLVPPASCDRARSSASAPMPPYLEKLRATLFVTLYLPP